MLNGEYNAYMRPAIASCASIRAMFDIVGNPADLDNPATESPPYLVFEWMDDTLSQLSSEKR